VFSISAGKFNILSPIVIIDINDIKTALTKIMKFHAGLNKMQNHSSYIKQTHIGLNICINGLFHYEIFHNFIVHY